MTWQEEDLIAAWRLVAASVPPPYELTGVTFHGPDDQPKWVAFVYSEELSSFGAEGIGSTPIEALEDLARELRSRM